MIEQEQLQAARRKTRRRLGFSLVTLILYSTYLLNYLPAGDFLRERIGSSWITGSLAMFVGLIVVFIALELLFLVLNNDEGPGSKGG